MLITRNLNDFSVSGQTPVIFNSTHRYEVPLYSGVSYSWQLPNGWTGSSSTNYIDVTVGCASGNITATMTGCNQSKSASLTIINNYISFDSQIIGDDVVCLSGTTFEISPNPPTGTSISWNSSFNLTQTAQSGITATYSANGSGTGWIEATVTIPGCTSITLPRKSTWMSNYSFHVTRPDGQPVTNDEYGDLSFCPNTDYEIYITPNGINCYSSDQIWTVPSTWTINYNNYSTISINTNDDPYNVIAVDFKSCCYDEDLYLSQLFEYSSSCAQYLLAITPNPSTTETTISIVSKTNTKIDENIEWDLEVFDSMQSLKTKTQKIKGDKQAINTTGWKAGVYIVRVKIGKEQISGKLVVQQ